MIRSTEHTTITQPTALPVRLDTTLDARRMALYVGGMLGGALVFGVGGWLASFGLAEDMAYRSAGGWLWLIVGVALAFAGCVTFGVSFGLLRHLSAFEREARAAYLALDLETRRAGRGDMQTTSVKTWEYGPVLEPAKVFLAAAWLLTYGPSRPSAIALAGDALTWKIGNQDRQLLRFSSEESAGRFLDLCADAGLIAGRGPRRGGELVPVDMETALDRVGKAMIRAERGGE